MIQCKAGSETWHGKVKCQVEVHDPTLLGVSIGEAQQSKGNGGPSRQEGDLAIGNMQTHWQGDSSALFHLLSISLVIQGLFAVYTNFRIACSISEKNSIGILIGITLNL